MNIEIKIGKNTLMNTPWQKKCMPHLIKLLTEEKGATYDEIEIFIIHHTLHIQPIDIKLLLGRLVREGYLNAENGVYKLNNTPENEPLFQECREYA